MGATLLAQLKMSVPFQRLYQQGQKGNQAFGANVIGGSPCQVERLLDCWSVVGRTWTLDGELEIDRMVQQPNGVFAGIACGGNKLIKDDLASVLMMPLDTAGQSGIPILVWLDSSNVTSFLDPPL